MTKLTILSTFAALFALVGCANEAGDEDTQSDESAVHAAPGTCVTNLPIDVWSYAAHLDLGRPISESGAAGSVYYTFTTGSVVRWSNVESKVSEVRLVPKEGTNKGTPVTVPFQVAKAAASNTFGGLVSQQAALGTWYFEFERGTVNWSNVESKLGEVKRTDGSKAGPTTTLAATKSSPSCLNSMPAAVWNIAAHVELGPVLTDDAAAGTRYFTFANGSEIRWSNVTEKLGGVKLVAKTGDGAGHAAEVPLDVVTTASSKGFGAYLSEDGAAGSMYYTFERGVVRWSNVESKVSDVTVK